MSYGGAVANVVGGELQGWAAVMSKWAMQKAYQDEINRQGQYSDQAMGNFNTALPGYSAESATKQMGENAQGRLQQYGGTNDVPLGYSLKGSQPLGRGVNAAADVTGRARANLGAYSDWSHNTGINQINQARVLNQILSFAKGTAGVFPYRMYGAQHSNDDLAMVGQAISSIGGGSANYGQTLNTMPQGRGSGGMNSNNVIGSWGAGSGGYLNDQGTQNLDGGAIPFY